MCMERKYSKIAENIIRDYKKEKQWKERLEEDKQEKIIILGEHKRKPLIIEED